MFLDSRKSCSLLCCGRSLCPRAKPNTRPNVEWFWVKLFLLRELKQKALVYGGSKIICDYEWSFVQRNQMAAVNPHMALKTITAKGVNEPRSRPIRPLFAFMGKTIKSWTKVGPRLKIRPLNKKLFCISGSKKSNPQIPPQTMRG